MPREIKDESGGGDFPPMVSIRTPGDYVKGTVVAIGKTTNGNPVATLAILDLEGKTTKSVAKGVYEDVEVNLGDHVQVIGSVKQLREAIPQLQVGEVVTITFTGKIAIPKGKTKNVFKVMVD